MPNHRTYTYLGTTQSLCPECLALVPAKIITRGKRVYFRKTCPTHGLREDFVCSDVKYYDRHEFSVPAKLPAEVGVEPDKGCPFDCGLCTEHEQHTCVGLVEITGSCNLTCPMCYASSATGGKHLSFEQVTAAIDRLVQVEGRAEVLQLSGGEPTIHPEFERIVEYALDQAIDYVQINTNGIRLSHDPALVERLARHRDRLEIFLQFDGLNEDIYRQLRGEPLLETKFKTIEILGQHDLHITLAATLQGGVNDDQWGPIVEFALARPWITGLNLQPATYSGRYYLPEEIEERVTFPQVIEGISEQTNGLLQPDDFMPLPCAHPNCHSLAMIFRSSSGENIPVNRFFDVKKHFDLLANGITFTRAKSRELALQYLSRQACCEGGGCMPAAEEDGGLPMLGGTSLPMVDPNLLSQLSPAATEFFGRVLNQELGARDLFRITITSFLDVYNFDVRRVMKCCTHHVLPSGHLIPFCAYNVLYRQGHVPLPELTLGQLVKQEWSGFDSLMQFNPYYSLIMLLSLVVGAILLRRWQEKLPLLWWQKLGIGLGAFCGEFLGAKLPFALYDWAKTPPDATALASPWLADGKTIMFGIIGGYLGVEVAKWSLMINTRTGDSYAVPVAVAVAIGRLACFVGGCCFGAPTTLPWGVCFAAAQRTGEMAVPRHPTQLYEFVFHLSAAALLWSFQEQGWFRYQLIKLYILAYLIFRFLTEFIRPEPEFFGGLTAYQWIAVVLFPIFIALWMQTAWSVRKELDKPVKPVAA